MRFLDANIFVYASHNNENTGQCQRAIAEGGLTDAFALAESFHIISRSINKERAIKAIRNILRSDIQIVDIDSNIIFQCLKKTQDTNLNFYDLIHYVVALSNNCTEIISYDSDFDNLEIPRKEPQV